MSDARVTLPPDVRRMNATADLVYGALTLVALAALLLWALRQPMFAIAHIVVRGDTAPGFFIKHIIKDMKIALECAEEMHLEMPGLQLAKRLYDQLSARGMEDCGTQTLIQWYMKQ